MFIAGVPTPNAAPPPVSSHKPVAIAAPSDAGDRKHGWMSLFAVLSLSLSLSSPARTLCLLQVCPHQMLHRRLSRRTSLLQSLRLLMLATANTVGCLSLLYSLSLSLSLRLRARYVYCRCAHTKCCTAACLVAQACCNRCAF